MSLHKYIERLKFIDELIRKKTSGNIHSLAKKLNLSKSGTEKFLKEMKEAGFPVCYCKKRKTYYYAEEGRMVKKLFDKEIGKDEMKK